MAQLGGVVSMVPGGVGVAVGVVVAVVVGLAVAVLVDVGVDVAVLVGVAVFVSVGVAVAVLVGDGVLVAVAVGVTVVDPTTNAIVWKYQEPVATIFFSPMISKAQRLPIGNTLVNEGSFGRIFEVSRDGDVVWEF